MNVKQLPCKFYELWSKKKVHAMETLSRQKCWVKKPAKILDTPSSHKQQPKPPFPNYSKGGRFHLHYHRKLYLFRDLDKRSWSLNENICCDISRIICEIADVHGDVKVECIVILTLLSAMKDQLRLRSVNALVWAQWNPGALGSKRGAHLWGGLPSKHPSTGNPTFGAR